MTLAANRRSWKTGSARTFQAIAERFSLLAFVRPHWFSRPKRPQPLQIWLQTY